MDAYFANPGSAIGAVHCEQSRANLGPIEARPQEIAASYSALLAMTLPGSEVSFHHFEDLYGSTCGRVTIATCAAPQLDDMLLQCIGLVAVSLLP
jgi:hypothetical protein